MLFDALKAVGGFLSAAIWMAAWQGFQGWYPWYLRALVGGVIVGGIVYCLPNKQTGHYLKPFPEGRKK